MDYGTGGKISFDHLPDAPDLRGQITIQEYKPFYSGSYSCVYRGIYEKDGEMVVVVVKILNNKIRGTALESMLRKLQHERRAWGALHHPNILPLYGFVDDEEFFQPGALVSPWLEKGDAESFLAIHGGSMEMQKRVLLWKDVVSGVSYLHSFNPVLIHGDLKPRNVLINESGSAQICDFGLSRIFLEEGSTGMTTISMHTGTERYLARELVVGGDEAHPTTASDVHALGCIGLEFIFLQMPYSNRKNNFRGVIYSDIKGGMPPGQRPDDLSTASEYHWTLIVECWNLDPAKRPNAPQLFEKLMARSGKSEHGDIHIPQSSGITEDAGLVRSESQEGQPTQSQTSRDPKSPVRFNDKGYSTYNSSSSSLDSMVTALETLPPARDRKESLQRSSGSLASTIYAPPLSTPGRAQDGPSLSETQAGVPLQPTQGRKVQLTVVAAESLIKRDVFAFPYPFVVVTVDSVQTQATEVIKRTLHPSWDQSFEFTVTESSVIELQIRDERKYNRTKELGCLGVVDFNVSKMLDLRLGGEETFTFDLKQKYDDIAVQGKIVIRLSTHISKPPGNQDPFGSSSVNAVKAPSTTGTPNPTPGVGQNSSNTEEQDGPLPSGWERRKDHLGRTYYVDHKKHTTSWIRPPSDPVKEIVSKVDLGPLPAGWKEKVTPEGRSYFVGPGPTTWVDPRQKQYIRSTSGIDAGW